jgi:hypothetical protein
MADKRSDLSSDAPAVAALVERGLLTPAPERHLSDVLAQCPPLAVTGLSTSAAIDEQRAERA